MDAADRELLAETFRKTMTAASGQVLDLALVDLGWRELLAELPDAAVPLAFRLLGETGAHAPLLNDVLGHVGGTVPIPCAGGTWVRWERVDTLGTAVDEDLPLVPAEAGGAEIDVAAGRRAVAWWLLGTGHAMLDLARAHALARTQFGRPIASFQAVRHRLAETLVALEGAEATLAAADDDFGALLAKAAAGQAALTAARHCQQVMGGIGFTAEHALQRHIKRALVLDTLLGGTRELTREAGAAVRREGRAPRLLQL